MAYWILKAILAPILRLFWNVRIEGREHIPRSGAAILAANHQSFCDSFFLPLVVPRRVTFVAKAEYFDSWRTAWFFRAAGQIPIRREGGDASERALATATEVLCGGGVLGIYPEGTRSPDIRLHKGRTGAVRLAAGCSVPIVPVGITGTRRIQPPGRRMMRPFHAVTVRFGEPLQVAATDGDPAALRRETDRLMAAIAALSGQDYVDTYAKARHALPPPSTGAAAAAEVHDSPSSAA